MGKPNVVFVLGGPGAGKGTQCENIVKNFGYMHLSAGELLRAERKKQNSEFRELIEKHLIAGSIVPVEITCSLLEQAMNNHIAKDSSANRFLIDGFPRNEDNLDGWTRQMGEKAHVQFVLFFDCSDETCIQRCLARGEAGSGRSDDNIQSLKNRILTYYESTMPIINRYEEKGLVRKVDAGRSVEEVFADVRKIFEAVKLS